MLAQTMQSVRRQNFVHRLSEVMATQVLLLLRQGKLTEAAHLTEKHDLPLYQARICLARGKPSAALAILEPLRQQMEERGWQDERLKVMVFQAVVLQAHGEKDKALHVLGDALEIAEPGGFIRLFIDEGPPMAKLLSEAVRQTIMPDYARKLLTAFDAEQRKNTGTSVQPAQSLLDPLSERELEVLQLIAQGLSNREICERLFLALPTVKGHNRKIFEKLDVKRRTEAVARARELGLL
jgi:LuxR family maltose regulon positive regulatory protein